MAFVIDLTGDEDEEMAKQSTGKRIVIDLTQDSATPPPPRQLPLPDFDALIRNNAPIDTPQPERFPFRHQPAPPKKPSLGDNRRDSLFDFKPEVGVHEPDHGSEVTIVPYSVSRTPSNCSSQAKPTDEFGRRIRKLHSPPTELVSLISPSPSPEPPVTAPRRASPSQQPWIQSMLSSVEPVAVPSFPGLTKRVRGVATRITQRSRAWAHAGLLRLGRLGSSLTTPIVILDDPEPAPTRDLERPLQGETLADVLVLFSDGSAINNRWCGCGVAFWDGQQWTGKAIGLGHHARGAYAAEALGIAEALKVAGQMLRPEHKVVEICTDHLGLVETIRNASESRIWRDEYFVEEVKDERERLVACGVEVRLTWVKGHDVHAGNEMADLLAGVGALRSSQGHFGSSRENPNPGEVAVSHGDMLKMSQRAESTTDFRRLTIPERALVEAQRRAQKIARKQERRVLKLKLKHREHQTEHRMEHSRHQMVLRSASVLPYA